MTIDPKDKKSGQGLPENDAVPPKKAGPENTPPPAAGEPATGKTPPADTLHADGDTMHLADTLAAHEDEDRAEAAAEAAPKRQRMLLTAVLCIAVLAVVAGLAVFLLRTGGEKEKVEEEAAPSAQPATEDSAEAFALFGDKGDKMENTGEDATTESAALVALRAVAEANTTGTKPLLKDPDTWAAGAAALMDRLAADPFYAKADFSVRPDQPYLAAVNRAASTVTIYAAGEDGRYTVPYVAMVCSGGEETPTGFYETPVNYQWRLLAGPSYGQYATRIWDAYLFHSVPYYSQHKDDVEYDEYNKLGTLASLGCIRLAVADVKWIYDNCPIGMPVVIYDDPENPGPMGKPGTIYTDPADEEKRGWDPTDPDPLNPWDDKYVDGTAIRSTEAQAEWDAAKADGRWTATINAADLQGWSTDSKIEGTRG